MKRKDTCIDCKKYTLNDNLCGLIECIHKDSPYKLVTIYTKPCSKFKRIEYD